MSKRILSDNLPFCVVVISCYSCNINITYSPLWVTFPLNQSIFDRCIRNWLIEKKVVSLFFLLLQCSNCLSLAWKTLKYQWLPFYIFCFEKLCENCCHYKTWIIRPHFINRIFITKSLILNFDISLCPS